MKTLYLECNMGAAGDMLAAALLELIPDPQSFIDRFQALGLPGVHMEREDSEKCGIRGTHMVITVNGEEEESCDLYEHHVEEDAVHGHVHEHHGEEHEHHGHTHAHRHSSMGDITALIQGLKMEDSVKEDAIAVYKLIAEAEGYVHGKPVEQIHFHEVGTMDAVADVVSVCMLMEELKPERITASPVHVGSGQVRCAHGILPVPAPATAHILKGVPIYGGQIRGELCTPTGAALLKYFVKEFGNMPVMRVEKIGYGMGKKDFETANCVRAMWGES